MTYRFLLEQDASDGRERSNGSKQLSANANQQIIKVHRDFFIFLPQSEKVETLEIRPDLRRVTGTVRVIWHVRHRKVPGVITEK